MAGQISGWKRCLAALATLATVLGVLGATPAQAERWFPIPDNVGTARIAGVELGEGRRLRVTCLGSWLTVRLDLPFRLRASREANVQVTLPDREPVSQIWSPYDSGLRVQVSSPLMLVRHLIAGRSPVVSYTSQSHGRLQFQVPVEGAAAAITPVVTACALTPDDLETLLPEVDVRVIEGIDTLTPTSALRLRGWLLGSRSASAEGPRPLELYRELNRFYTLILPSVCLEEQGAYWEMPSCRAFRAARATYAYAPFPVEPVAAAQEFANWTAADRSRLPQPEPVEVINNPCGQPDSEPRLLSQVPVERLYPRSALERGVSGVVNFSIAVDAQGGVAGIRHNWSLPPDVFEDQVREAAQALRFSPAIKDCQAVAGEYMLTVAFEIVQ